MASCDGIRSSWRGSSQPNPYRSKSLSLYVLRGSDLINVLGGLTVYEYSGEWDTRCAGDFTTREMAIVAVPSVTSFADLLVKEKVTKTVAQYLPLGCQNISSSTENNEYMIKYGIDNYVIPDKLRSLAW
jgi:hypothetical protein